MRVQCIEREYGLGRRRTDLPLIWRYPDAAQRVVLELKWEAAPQRH